MDKNVKYLKRLPGELGSLISTNQAADKALNCEVSGYGAASNFCPPPVLLLRFGEETNPTDIFHMAKSSLNALHHNKDI